MPSSWSPWGLVRGAAFASPMSECGGDWPEIVVLGASETFARAANSSHSVGTRTGFGSLAGRQRRLSPPSIKSIWAIWKRAKSCCPTAKRACQNGRQWCDRVGRSTTNPRCVTPLHREDCSHERSYRFALTRVAKVDCVLLTRRGRDGRIPASRGRFW